MSPRRIAFWLLVTAGVAVGHVLGYVVAHPDSAAREAALGGHAYLPMVASAVIPLGVIAALGWAVHTARQLGLAGQISAGRLAVAQVAVFIVQEVGERLVTGEAAASVLGERGVWFGLVAQVLVAHLVVRSIDLVRSAVRFATASSVRRTVTLLLHAIAATPAAIPSARRPTVSVGLRAPPFVGSSQ